MKIAIGCDEAGFDLKEIVVAHLKARGVEAVDYGVPSAQPKPGTDYPDIARAVAEDIARGVQERGILICGTGIGMAISANKVPGVRAAQAHDTYSAQRARKSNDAQVLTFGARVIGPELAKSIVDAWLESDFEGGNSTRKVDKMKQIDADYHATANSVKAIS
jgi:ribose 5-phosphate isomerase B